jgi:hypothetical protein
VNVVDPKLSVLDPDQDPSFKAVLYPIRLSKIADVVPDRAQKIYSSSKPMIVLYDLFVDFKKFLVFLSHYSKKILIY